MKKVLRILLLIVLVFIGILIVLGLVGPKSYDASRSAFIPATPAQVWPHVSSLQAMQTWSPWIERDPNMTIEYSGEAGQVGSSYTWSGNNQVGKGEQTLTKADAPYQVETELKFFMPWGVSVSTSYLSIADTTGGSKVTWGLRGDNDFIGRIFASFTNMDAAIGKDFEEGLAALKDVVGAAPGGGDYAIQEVAYPGGQYLGVRSNISMDQMQPFFATNLPKVVGTVQQAGLQMTGMPCGLYYVWDMEKGMTDMAAAVGFSGKLAKVPDGMTVIDVPASKALVVDYLGGYSGLAGPHNALDAYIQEKGLSHFAPVIEEYVTDPGAEPDSTKWLTRITYLIK